MLKAGGKKLGGIAELQLQLGSSGRIREAVSDVGERSGVAQRAGCLLEVFIADHAANLKTAGSDDILVFETLCSLDLDRRQNLGGILHLCGRTTLGGKCNPG